MLLETFAGVRSHLDADGRWDTQEERRKRDGLDITRAIFVELLPCFKECLHET